MTRSGIPNAPWADLNFFLQHEDVSNRELARRFGGSESNWRRWRDKHGLNPSTATTASVSPVVDEPVQDLSGDPSKYRQSHSLNPDKSQTSDKLIMMSEEDFKDEGFLLRAHGFDEDIWEIISAKNNIWNMASKDPDGEHRISTLYSSRITVKKRVLGFDIQKVAEILGTISPVTIMPMDFENSTGLLELGFYDMHMGLSTLKNYIDCLIRAVDIIRSRHRSQIVIPVGSDVFHHDNFKGTTSNGTALEDIDWTNTWSETAQFFFTLIEEALAYADHVFIVFVKGNHDESMAWAFCQMLAIKYPQVTVNLDIKERKVHTYENICLGFTHGDKAMKDIDRIFMCEFPEFATAPLKEIHTGHFHHEVVKDSFGTIIRALCTANRTDHWHDDKGFVGAQKRFQLFEFDENTITDIHYV
jgi:hypothetical protein